MKVPCWIKKTHEFRKRNENLDRQDEHVSSENEDRLGNSYNGDEGDFNSNMLSKRKKICESGKSNGVLDRKEHHVFSENEGRLGNSVGIDDAWVKMRSRMKKTHESIERDGSLDKRDKHVSSEIDGKLGTNRINDEGQSKMKAPCWIRKTHESVKRNDNLDKKDEHVSLENKDRLGNSNSGDEGDFNPNTLSKRKKRFECVKSNGGLDGKEHHVFSETEGRLGNSVGNDNAWMDKPFGMKKTHESIESDGSLDKRDKHVSSEIDSKLGTNRINDEGQSKMKVPCWIRKTHEYGKRNENLDKKDEHVSSKNEDKLDNSNSGDEGDFNPNTLSKRKKRCKFGKSNGGLDRKEHHVFSETEGRLGNSVGNNDAWMKVRSRMKKTHESTESDGSLDKRDKHVSSEIDSKLGTNRINDEGQSKMKVRCWIKKAHESGKRNENLDKKDKRISSENEDRLGNGNSGDEGDFNSNTLRKKRCGSGKSNEGLEKKENHVFLENEGRLGNSVGNDDAWMNLKKPVGGGTPGCWIGKLFVSNTEIAKGSKGTIILEGFYEGRSVAVKRLVRAHHYVASQEIQSLTASDQDPNIVRLYGEENDQDFVYLALERCACSLDDLILAHSNSSEKSVFPDDPASNAIIEYKMRLDSVKGTMQDVNLWREDGHPSPLLLKLMRDVVSGLVHLHCLGIIHRDLKPQSVLITKELCAKLTDMGSSKLLSGDTSPLGYHVTDCGSPGLQEPEQLCPVHQTCSVDLFGLGCILFFCVTGGRHPFGVSLKDDSNIKEYPIDLSPVEFLPEAADLFARLLNPNPNLRPKALEVLHHPLFWNSKTRLSFLRDVSDWVESRARGTKSDLLEKLESIAQHVFDEEWNEKIDRKVIKHQCRFREYKFKRVRDLLRIVRNTFSHYRELPPKIQEIVGSSPEDLDCYFVKRFPRLLIETYRFVSMCCEDEGRSPFPEYFNW